MKNRHWDRWAQIFEVNSFLGENVHTVLFENIAADADLLVNINGAQGGNNLLVNALGTLGNPITIASSNSLGKMTLENATFNGDIISTGG